MSRYPPTTLANYPVRKCRARTPTRGLLAACGWVRVSSVRGVGREGLFRGSAARRALGRPARRGRTPGERLLRGGQAARDARPGVRRRVSTSSSLWQGAWIAALATGVVVWGLIFYVVIRFRRRSDDEIPIQTRYNLPLEIFYTIAPVVMVVVFFAHTVRTQNIVLEDETPPDNIIEVTGQQWSWTFNYGLGEPDNSADDDRFDDKFAYDSVRPRRRHRLLHPRAVAAGRRDHPVQPAQPRRHPRLRRPRLPDADGRRPGPGQPLRHQADPDRHLHGPVLRALRGLPLADAVHGARRQPRGLRRAPRRSSRTPGRPPTSRCSAARTPTPRTVSSPRESPSDCHRFPPQHRRRRPPPAGPAGRPGPDHHRPQGDRQPLPRSRRSAGSSPPA